MTLATEGEASDGDILSMEGGQIPERMPLLLSHYNDPTAIAGSVTNPSKELKHSPPRLRATGQIELDGPEGPLRAIRRDVAHMINTHGGAVSIRWDEVDGGDPPVRRVNLPSDHPYFVDSETERSWRKREGYFWPSWKGLEGSIVALGADGDATIGGRLYAQRADETEGEVSKFWRAMADDARHESQSVYPVEEIAEIEADDIRWATTQAGIVAELATCARNARSFGAEPHDIANAVCLSDEAKDFEIVTIGDTQVFLPQRLADQLADERKTRAETPAQQETEPEPEPTEARAEQHPPLTLDAAEITAPLDVRALAEFVSKKLDESEERLIRNVRGILASYTGKVSKWKT